MFFMVCVPCLATVIDGFVSGAVLTVHFSLTHHWQAMYELVSLHLEYKCEFMLTIITFSNIQKHFLCVINQYHLLKASSLLEMNFLQQLFVYMYVLFNVCGQENDLDLTILWFNTLIACFSLTDCFDIDLQLLLVVKLRKVCQFHLSSTSEF